MDEEYLEKLKGYMNRVNIIHREDESFKQEVKEDIAGDDALEKGDRDALLEIIGQIEPNAGDKVAKYWESDVYQQMHEKIIGAMEQHGQETPEQETPDEEKQQEKAQKRAARKERGKKIKNILGKVGRFAARFSQAANQNLNPMGGGQRQQPQQGRQAQQQRPQNAQQSRRQQPRQSHRPRRQQQQGGPQIYNPLNAPNPVGNILNMNLGQTVGLQQRTRRHPRRQQPRRPGRSQQGGQRHAQQRGGTVTVSFDAPDWEIQYDGQSVYTANDRELAIREAKKTANRFDATLEVYKPSGELDFKE